MFLLYVFSLGCLYCFCYYFFHVYPPNSLFVFVLIVVPIFIYLYLYIYLLSDNSAGAVYLYGTTDGGTTWTLTQSLTPTDIEAGSAFGSAVALAGETLFVGAPNGLLVYLL